MTSVEDKEWPYWRQRLHEIIFESDTPEGRLFDLLLLMAILVSLTVVLLESVSSIRNVYGAGLRVVEWFFTAVFTLEYILRALSMRRPRAYIMSFFGVVDLLSILPSYLSLVLPGTQSLLVIRSLRFLRIFRVLKLGSYLSEAQVLGSALRASRNKITVFLGTVTTLVFIMGSLMYVIEGEKNGFTSIPVSIYWAVVTLTTVGYGDIAPRTPLGQAIAASVMILGYAIIAVPTGIVSVELAEATKRDRLSSAVCPHCAREGHDSDAVFCKACGGKL